MLKNTFLGFVTLISRLSLASYGFQESYPSSFLFKDPKFFLTNVKDHRKVSR